MEIDPHKYDFSVDGYIETCKGMDKETFSAYYNVTPPDIEDIDYHRIVALKDCIRHHGEHRHTGSSGTRQSHQ